MAMQSTRRPSLTRPLSRRGFFAFTGAGGAAAAAALYGYSGAPVWASPRLPSDPFTLGVASGDPTPDGFVLWTRLAPEPLAPDGLGGMPTMQVPVTWQVATDPEMRAVVRAGTAKATPELGHSVHPEVSGLQPSRDYWYRFRVGDVLSPIGHTRTAPAAGSTPAQLTFALASCQALPANRRYAAYRAMLSDDLDLVVHVGDYTYERGDDETLADFRTNHARHKLSPDLQAAHAAFPFVLTFDDHEIENNWADEVSQPDNEPSNERSRFIQLRANAFQAYYEHLPLRLAQRPQGPDMLLHRRLDYGTLASFHVLDTRQYRSDQLTEAFPGGPQHPDVNDPSRTLMGDEQERWLFGNLERSTARWNLVAQQTIMAQVDYDTSPGMSVNHDQWDGYAVSRNRFLSFLDQARPHQPRGTHRGLALRMGQRPPTRLQPPGDPRTRDRVRRHLDQLRLWLGGSSRGGAPEQPPREVPQPRPARVHPHRRDPRVPAGGLPSGPLCRRSFRDRHNRQQLGRRSRPTRRRTGIALPGEPTHQRAAGGSASYLVGALL
jgi:alkaline phosphatase D